MLKAASELGYETGGYDNSMPQDGSVAYYYQRNALYDPNVTGSQDGRPVAPLLGSIPDFGGGVADVQIGPVSYGIFYPDHAVLYRFQPRDVQKTDMDLLACRYPRKKGAKIAPFMFRFPGRGKDRD